MEARVLRCSGCGASVPPDAVQCPYCQAQLATVACPACFALVPLTAKHCPACGVTLAPRQASAAAGAPCPACAKPLALSKVGDLDVCDCRACGGLWLDRAVFEQLGADRERQGAILGALPAQVEAAPLVSVSVQYRPCPACGQRMNRTNYAKRSGVVLDVCKAHGLWFDQDELRRVLAFIASGGLERARERELEDLREAQRAVTRPEITGAGLGLAMDAPEPSGWLSAAGLLGLALGAAHHLLDRD
jgi:Zn-finger nucleic acid-binding protein